MPILCAVSLSVQAEFPDVMSGAFCNISSSAVCRIGNGVKTTLFRWRKMQ